MVEGRLEPTLLNLRNYSGNRLDVVGQVKTHISRPVISVEATVQVQKGAPANLLIGTDLLTRLGFLFVKEELCGEDAHLLQVEDSSTSKGKEVGQVGSSTNFLSGSLDGNKSVMPDGVVCLFKLRNCLVGT